MVDQELLDQAKKAFGEAYPKHGADIEMYNAGSLGTSYLDIIVPQRYQSIYIKAYIDGVESTKRGGEHGVRTSSTI